MTAIMQTLQEPALPATILLNARLAQGLKELIVLLAKMATSSLLMPIVMPALLDATLALQMDH